MGLYAVGKGLEDRGREAGYTLTEMLVVVAIIGLISAVVIPQTIGQLGKAQARTARLEAQNIQSALELFSGDNGRYPSPEEGLTVLMTRPPEMETWMGPYIRDREQLIDPWGQAYLYTHDPDVGAQVSSLGADHKPGGEGSNRDIVVK